MFLPNPLWTLGQKESREGFDKWKPSQRFSLADAALLFLLRPPRKRFECVLCNEGEPHLALALGEGQPARIAGLPSGRFRGFAIQGAGMPRGSWNAHVLRGVPEGVPEEGVVFVRVCVRMSCSPDANLSKNYSNRARTTYMILTGRQVPADRYRVPYLYTF